jgi:hypothetical protein
MDQRLVTGDPWPARRFDAANGREDAPPKIETVSKGTLPGQRYTAKGLTAGAGEGCQFLNQTNRSG